MFISIKPNSSTPIYTQLIYQIKKGIIKKELLPGESLPSVRSLAGDIGINMHTVNKAYKILVEQGVLVQQKKGFMVNLASQMILEENYFQEYREKFEELLVDATLFNLTDEMVEALKNEILDGINRSEK